jgi:hypothetical protein
MQFKGKGLPALEIFLPGEEIPFYKDGGKST